MAKKAQANAKSAGKTSVKATVKTAASVSAKKPAKASASPKATPKVLTAKEAPKGVAKPVAQKVVPAATKKSVEVAPAETPKKSAKASQAAETSEKIKIDKSMSDEQIKWAEMYNKFKDTQASAYDMKATFKAATALQHKVLGWGWIVSNDNDRLEVLFKDGKRMLISNYRG